MHGWRTRPALYNKTQSQMLKINLIMFRSDLDVFIDVCGIPDEKQKLNLRQN